MIPLQFFRILTQGIVNAFDQRKYKAGFRVGWIRGIQEGRRRATAQDPDYTVARFNEQPIFGRKVYLYEDLREGADGQISARVMKVRVLPGDAHEIL